MQQPGHPEARTFKAPRFYTTVRQPLRPEVILLAVVIAVAVLAAIIFAMSQTRAAHFSRDGAGTASSTGAASDDDKDDPSQIDTIVLGDPSEAPRPGRRGDHVSPVHPTILVSLPRFGNQVGLIPDTPSGRLLYAWLAAFNQTSSAGLASALPSVAPEAAAAAQLKLRQQTGGFELLSAKEVQPGVLVFRLRDQSPLSIEVLGTLQVNEETIPATIASFSLRDVPQRQRTSEVAPSPESPK